MELRAPGSIFARILHARRLVSAIRLGGWVVAGLILAAAIMAIWQRDALEKDVLARESLATLQASVRLVDTVLRTTQAVLDTAAASSRTFYGENPSAIPQPLLKSLVADVPFLGRMMVLNADGGVVVDSTPNGMTLGKSFANRPYFTHHLNAGALLEGVPFIGASQQNRIDGRWIIPVSQAFTDSHGNFAGVFVAALDVNYLVRAFADAAVDRSMAVSLVHLDGTLLARWPEPRSLLGERLPDSAVRRQIADGKREGGGAIVSPTDGRQRRLQYRRLDGLPVAVVVGHDEEGLLNLALNDLAAWLAIALAGVIAFPLGSLVISRALDEAKLAIIRAEHADARKTQFLANTSHELRTPLNAILGYAEILRDDVFRANIPPRYREYGAAIYASGEHLLAIVNDILDINVLLRDHVQLQEDDILVEQLIAETLNLSGARSQSAIEVTTPDPADLASVTLFCDERRSVQALVNLLGNALRHTPAGGMVAIRLEANAPGLRLIVEDTGPGVPDAVLRQLGRPFPTTGDSYVSSKQGTGLGLAITHRIMELHSGRLTLSNRPEGGARAVLDFPESRLIRNPI